MFGVWYDIDTFCKSFTRIIFEESYKEGLSQFCVKLLIIFFFVLEHSVSGTQS